MKPIVYNEGYHLSLFVDYVYFIFYFLINMFVVVDCYQNVLLMSN